MYELKALSHTAIPAALAQAERYRLLNEPAEAESICLDILRIEPDHQDALVMMVLALTDQFPDGGHARVAADAEKTVARVRDEYKRFYMTCYERAEAIRPPDNDEAVLRWNTCARILMGMPAHEPDLQEFSAIQSE
jgi:hypothetical protein